MSLPGKTLYFHSKSCALKFFKALLEHLDPDMVSRAANEVEKEFKELLEKRRAERAKAI